MIYQTLGAKQVASARNIAGRKDQAREATPDSEGEEELPAPPKFISKGKWKVLIDDGDCNKKLDSSRDDGHISEDESSSPDDPDWELRPSMADEETIDEELNDNASEESDLRPRKKAKTPTTTKERREASKGKKVGLREAISEARGLGHAEVIISHAHIC